MVFLVLCFFTPLGKSSLVMTIDSNINGETQLFYYPKDKEPTEKNSIVKSLVPGENQLSFELPFLPQMLRWDPSQQDANIMQIKNVTLRAGLFNFSVEMTAISPVLGVNVVEVQPRDLKIVTHGTDPQMTIITAANKAFLWQSVILLLVTCIMTGFIWKYLSFSSRRIQQCFDSLCAWFYKEQNTIKFFPVFFLIAVFFYFTELATFTISIDDEISLVAKHFSGWIGQGRWTNYLLYEYLIPQGVLPYFPHLMFVLGISLSYLFVLRAHDLKVNMYTVAVFPIFCAFPTWILIAAYHANITSVALGILLLSIAVYIFRWCFIERLIKDKILNASYLTGVFCIQSVLIATALGTYQSLIFVFACMGLGIILFIALNQTMSLTKLIKALVGLGILLFSSLIIYYIINKLALYLTNTEVGYINIFYNPQLFLTAPLSVIGDILHDMQKVYLGSSTLYGASLGAIGGLLVLGLGTILLNPQKSGYLILCFLMMLAPFSLHVIAGGSYSLPTRSLLAVPYVLWFFALLAAMDLRPIIRGLAAILLIIGTLQMLYIISLYSANAQVAQKHDELLAQSLYQEIAKANPSFNRNKIYPVCFFGVKTVKTFYPKELTSAIGDSIFSMNESRRFVFYMNFLGFDNLEILEDVRFDPYFKTMPTWPANGSVKVVDGVTLIKLGEK